MMAKYQSPNKWLPLLPYKEKLYEDSDDFLNSILQNLALSIRRRDLKVSGSFYISQLQRYYNLFHLRFPKETHVAIIKLLYEIVTVPQLELIIVLRAANLLSALLKKKKLLTRADLQLAWRPLYNLWRFVDYSTYETCGLIYVPSDITKHVKNLVKACRSYFPKEATQEMLEEWRPWLCPYDTKMQDALTMMDAFLPTDLPPDLASKHGYGLWLDEILRFWLMAPSKFGWHTQVVTILARLSWDMCGLLKWTPYLDVVFSDLLCSFSIPVGTSQLNVTVKGHTGDPETLAFLLAALIGPHPDGQAAFERLERLCNAVATHLHPSNGGKWQQTIVSFLDRLTQLVCLRWRRENRSSDEEEWWFDYTPSAARLDNNCLQKLARLLLPLAECAAFSKMVQSDIAVSPLVNLLQMCPHVVMPTVLANLDSSLETLTEPHRLYSCLRVASSAVVYLAADKCSSNSENLSLATSQGLPPPGRQLIVPLLLSLLPGLDPNDLRKTYLCGQILALVVMQVPLVDCSQAASVSSDASNELLQSTAQFEDFLTSFMDRFFQLVEAVAHSSVSSASPAAGDRQSIEEQALEEGLTPLLALVVGQADDRLKQTAVDYLFRWIIEHRLDATTSGRIIAKLCQATASAAQDIYVERFVPFLVEKIEDYFKERPGLMEEEKLDNDLLWFLAILSQSCAVDGRLVLAHLNRLKSVLRLTLLARCRKTSAIAVAMLRHVLKALTRVFPMETRSLEESEMSKTVSGSTSYWGYFYRLNEINVKWHVPSEEEFLAVKSLIDELLVSSVSWLESYASGNFSGPMRRETLEQHVRVVRSFVRSLGPFLPFWTAADCEADTVDGQQLSNLVECAVPMETWPIHAGYDPSLTATTFLLKGQNLRRYVLLLSHRLLEKIRLSNDDYAKPLCEIIGLIETVLLDGGQQKSGRTDTALRVNDMMSRYMQPFLPVAGVPRHYHRLWVIDRVDVQHQNIVANSRPRIFSRLHETAMLNLFRLSMHSYSEVRKTAQSALHCTRAGYPYSYRCIMEPLCEVLRTGGLVNALSSAGSVVPGDVDPDNRLKGALYDILGSADQCLVTKRSWQVLAEMLPLLIELRLPEKPSLQDLIDRIVDRFDSTFETFTLELKHPESLVEAAVKLCPKVSNDSFSALEFEKRNNDSWKASYDLLNSRLAEILANPTLPSRSLLIGLDFFRYLLRYDYPCSPALVEVVLQRAVGDTPQQVTLCVDALLSICRQIRRRPSKVLKTFKESSKTCNSMQIGERPDNSNFLYDVSKPIILSVEEWQNQMFVDKSYLGFSCWPSDLGVYTGASILQPVVGDGIDKELMSQSERFLYNYFCGDCKPSTNGTLSAPYLHTFVDRLVHQVHAGEGITFLWKVVYIFKTLLRLFHPVLLEPLLDEIDRLVADEQPSSAPASQATAAELFAAVIRASKFWSFELLNRTTKRLVSSLETALKNMTADWEDCWISCFSTLASFSRLYRRFGRVNRNRTMTTLMSLSTKNIGRRLARALGRGRPTALLRHRNEAQPMSIHSKFRSKSLGLVAGDLDPRRIHWLISWLLNDWQSGTSSSSSERSAAAEATRLSLLQALVEQTEWRAPSLKALVFSKVVSGSASPYKNVRHRAGQFVASILTTDPSWFAGANNKSSLPTWELLNNQLGIQIVEWVSTLGPSSSQSVSDATGRQILPPPAELPSSASSQSITETNAKSTVLNSPEFCRCKLLMEVVTASVGAVVTKMPVCLIDLLPAFVSLDAIAIGIDDELRTLAITSSAILGMGRLDSEPVKLKALNIIESLCREHPSWQTRRQALCVLQVSVFHNLYELSISTSFANRICDLLVSCLDDTTVEVREMASVTLSGLLQCGYFKPSSELIVKFNAASTTRVGLSGTANREVAIRHRHAGVLGLAAVVTAYPYSVPSFLPAILIALTDHVGDPPPIAATARRALTDFRRTHHDQWFVHREHFTEDQLAALSSVLVSPNYYA